MEQLLLFAECATETPVTPAARMNYSCELILRQPCVREACGPQIKCAQDVANLFSDAKCLAKEAFFVATLDQKNRLIDRHAVSIGTLTGALVHPREALWPALADNAAAVAYVHNHPSGDVTPSRDDREITARLLEAGKLLGFRTLDHVIIGRDQHFSFCEEGWL